MIKRCRKCKKEYEVPGWQLKNRDYRCRDCVNKYQISKPKDRRKDRRHNRNRSGAKDITWRTWYNMIKRCENPRDIGYKYYGARGITVCSEWRASFEAFLLDMGIKPHGLTIERINNDGNYERENCRWATRAEQNRNKRPHAVVMHQLQQQNIRQT